MKRAVVMIIDGLRADMVGKDFTPELAGMIEKRKTPGLASRGHDPALDGLRGLAVLMPPLLRRRMMLLLSVDCI